MARHYAQENKNYNYGYVILNLNIAQNIIKNPNIAKIETSRNKFDRGEQYLVVNNPNINTGKTYSLPLGVVPLAGDTEKFKSCLKEYDSFTSSKTTLLPTTTAITSASAFAAPTVTPKYNTRSF